MIDYNGIQQALKTILETGPLGGYTTPPDQVFAEAMERDAIFSNMPFLNVRLLNSDAEVINLSGGQTSDYYATISLEVDVIAFDLTHFSEAASLRDTLLREAQLAVIQNKNFHADIQTSTVAPNVAFNSAGDEDTGAHVAIATFSVSVEVDVQ